MRTSALLPLLAALLAAMTAGCSSEKKLAGHLENGARYLAAGDLPKAEIEYRNVIQLDPTSKVGFASLGSIYYDQARLSMMGAYLTRAHELDRENLDVRLKLGFIHLAFNQFNEARDHALYVLERRPEDPDAPILLAESARQPAEREAARTRLGALPAAAREGAPVNTALATLAIRDEQVDVARTALDRALERDARYSPAHAAYAFIHRRANNLEEAGRSLQRASEFASPRSTRRMLHAQFLLQTDQADAARQALQTMTRETPDFISPHLLLADMSARAQQWSESEDHLKKVLALDPGHPEALLLSARLKLAQGKSAVAVEEMDRMARAYPGLPQAHYQLGMAHYASGDLTRAAQSLRQAVTLLPGYVDAVVLLADLNVRQGAFDEAIAALDPVIKERPESIQAQLILANAYRGKRDLDSALGVYRRLQAALPNNPQTHLLVGTVLRLQNQRSEARVAFNRAIELAPNSLLALEQLATLDVQEGQPAAALARIDARLAAEPTLVPVHLLKARVQMAQRDLSGAEATLQQAATLAADAAEPHEMLAQVYGAGGQTEKAIASLRAAAERNPRNIDVLMALASHHERQKDFAASRELYDKILAVNPRHGPALNNLAYLHAEHLGDLAKAQELAQRAREVLPNDPMIADTLGWIMYRQGQYTWALALLQESAARLPDHAEIQYHLGMAQYMTGAEAAARSSLVKALQLAADFPGRADAVQHLEVLSIDATTPAATARAALEKALSTQPNDPIALVRLAALEEQAGKADAALALYAKALKASPASLAAAGPLTRLQLARGARQEALEVARALRQTVPGDADVALLGGRVALATGDYPWALGLLQEAAQQRPADRDVQFDLAQAAYAVGRTDEAEAALRRCLQGSGIFLRSEEARRFQQLIALGKTPSASGSAQIDAALAENPRSLPARFARGVARANSGDVAGARTDLKSVLTDYPDFAPAKRQLTLLAASGTGVDADALALALKAREAFPTDAELGKAYGILLYRQGTYAQALTLLDESTRQRTQDAEAWYYLGATQHQLKRTDEAKASLEKALGLNLSSDLAAEARKLLQP